MRLSAGDILGPYEILAPIGEGAMGEVYKAGDTKLDREVAIKVLPAALARDVERLARLEREARVLASLNHPKIAQIYGIEESSTGSVLIMELVPGQTLNGSIPLVEALRVATQMADAQSTDDPLYSVVGSRSIQLSLRLSIRLFQKSDPGQRSTLP